MAPKPGPTAVGKTRENRKLTEESLPPGNQQKRPLITSGWGAAPPLFIPIHSPPPASPRPASERKAFCKLRLQQGEGGGLERDWREREGSGEKGRGQPRAVPPIGSVSASARCCCSLGTAEQSSLLHSNCPEPVCGGWTTEAAQAAEGAAGLRLRAPPASSPRARGSPPHPPPCLEPASQLWLHSLVRVSSALHPPST